MVGSTVLAWGLLTSGCCYGPKDSSTKCKLWRLPLRVAHQTLRSRQNSDEQQKAVHRHQKAEALGDIFSDRSSEVPRTTGMGQPSFQASNALIYLTYGAFLYVGQAPFAGWRRKAMDYRLPWYLES